jgi:threonine synthase
MPLLKCVSCSLSEDSDDLDPSCRRCGSPVLLADRIPEGASRKEFDGAQAGVWRFRSFLPDVPPYETVTLGEGGTPLLPAHRLGAELGLKRLMLKDESRNPTGSFFDRGATVLVSLARKRAIRSCGCVTTGNLGASLAAYCAKGGIDCRVRIGPNVDRGKLYQMLVYGAEVEGPSGRPAAPQDTARTLSVDAANPYLLEGEKTTSFEIIQELGWKTPDAIVVPVGTGGHLSMIWRGIEQFRRSGLSARSNCRILCVQLEGSEPMMGRKQGGRGTHRQDASFTELEESEPIFREEVARAISESGGQGVFTTEAATVKATGLLARTEGIFAEPASASVVASLDGAAKSGLIHRDEVVVCVITGSGLKDTRAVSRLAKAARRVTVRDEVVAGRTQIGDTKLAVLRLLQGSQRYGYQIWQELSSQRHMTTASVYQHLSELEGGGLVRRTGVVAVGGRDRVVYELTRRGKDFLGLADKMGKYLPQ